LLGYPIVDRNLRELVRRDLGANPRPHQVARKAAARGGVSQDIATLSGTIWGTFSARNDAQLGWVERHSHNVLSYFPNDAHRMDRYADWIGVSQAQLFVTVTKAGEPNSRLEIFGENVAFSDFLSAPLDSVGPKISNWIDVILIEGTSALTQWVVIAPSREGPTGGDPPGGLEFGGSAPGNLRVEGGQYYGDWCVDQTNFGYTRSQVRTLIHSFLDDPSGWAAAGITFREVPEAQAKVRFQVVSEATCNSPELACTHYGDQTYVELEYGPMQGTESAGIGPGNLINHEAGHAFFFAQHSGNDGIMIDFDANRPEKPIASDIASLETWLGEPGEAGAGTFAVGLCQLRTR
jgi:hypothetical protein